VVSLQLRSLGFELLKLSLAGCNHGHTLVNVEASWVGDACFVRIPDYVAVPIFSFVPELKVGKSLPLFVD
jgi:hypothetical protein